jgi:endonuclease G, mitochondrial
MNDQDTEQGAILEALELNLDWYTGNDGYDPQFLGPTIPLPQIPESRTDDIVPLKDGSGDVLDYTHFSVVLSKSRRLAYFTAVNIDGAQSKSLPRSGDRWYFDPRIEKAYQSGPDLYWNNPLDRGHLVRRLDPVWGEQAEKANEDTFHFTNAAPQHSNLNQRTWLDLEDYILKHADREDIRVTVFTGPIFRPDDMLYRGEYRIPAEYWKVVVIVKEDGQISATAYMQTQKNLIVDLEFAYGGYKTYQVPVSLIAELTELDFGELPDFDPLATLEATTVGRIVTGAESILL